MADGADKARAAGDAAKDGTDGAAAPAGKMKALLPYLIGGVVSAGLGITAGVVTQPTTPTPQVQEEAPKPEPTPLDKLRPAREIALPTLIVTLADTGAAASGKLNLVLQVRVATPEAEDSVAAACTKGGASAAQMRDALITLCSGKQSADLRTPRGKEELKLEILDKLSPIVFPDPSVGTITGLYFDEFVVQ